MHANLLAWQVGCLPSLTQPTPEFRMDIRQQLLKINSRANADLVEEFVTRNPEAIVELMACFCGDERVVAQRAAQVVGNLGRSHPERLRPWWEPILDAAEQPVHVALRRNVARYFSELTLSIPEAMEQKIVCAFAKWIEDPELPVAVAVFAMQFIADRSQRYPDAAKALVRTIGERLPASKPGFRNRALKILRQLD